MAERKRYVVDMNAMKVRDMFVDDGIEYEIIATEEEVKEIRKLFNEMKDDTAESLKYILIPFDEKQVDKERESYDGHLFAIFRLIRDLGTEKTKADIASMKLLE